MLPLITYRKIGPDWGIQSEAELEVGSRVTVTLKSGKTKDVTVGDFSNRAYGKYIYRVAPEPKPAAKAVGDLSGILALFAKAKQTLKFPAIVVGVPVLLPNGEWERDGEGNLVFSGASLRINVAGERAKVPGSLTVLDADKNGNNRRDWLGRILTDGTFEPGFKGNGPSVIKRLREFAADPAKVAGEDGRLHGRCSFCRLPLKDERSTAVGYGPICAKHFGLPWGELETKLAA
jgi:hypothetical protein